MTGGSGGVEIPGPGHHGARPRIHSGVYQTTSRAKPRRLSAQLCEAWQWRQANGALCDMVCRGLLLMLHRAGEIELPPAARYRPIPSSGVHGLRRC